VHPNIRGDELRRRFAIPLTETPRDPGEVLRELVDAAEPGLVATSGPRYFGFVIGGAYPVSIAADWLTSAWDQHGTFFASSPASSVCEDAVASWLRDLFGLPPAAGVGFTTGCQMANFAALAAARNALLAGAGWNVERDGLRNAPPLAIVAGEEAHVTISAALRLLGFGAAGVHLVPSDEQGRMRAELLEDVLQRVGCPSIVCAQAGNVNSGAFDPFETICEVTHRHGGWVHVDGAFGIWAAASPRYRALTVGLEDADSWAADAHKWLNVPYDSGFVIVRNAAALRGAMTLSASYLQQTEGAERDGIDWVPESSRRARGFVLWATLQTLGRSGVAELVDRCCALARQFAERLSRERGVTIVNEVVLNQVLVHLDPPAGRDATEFTRDVTARVQRSGICWLGSTTWHGVPALRISVSGWNTTPADVELSSSAIVDAYRAAAAV
ncbi:MAG TPA: aminotransferase class V-fold PLP-dependent enzyme, partial [Thermoanaerobaculia bacterium]|nr:aminotransferase class V-fold PLP-dependent enzyme [Thermoanaerobaculia bacterium]